jgi:hypothetical protein
LFTGLKTGQEVLALWNRLADSVKRRLRPVGVIRSPWPNALDGRHGRDDAHVRRRLPTSDRCFIASAENRWSTALVLKRTACCGWRAGLRRSLIADGLRARYSSARRRFVSAARSTTAKRSDMLETSSRCSVKNQCEDLNDRPVWD